jgi:hypothetical protein
MLRSISYYFNPNNSEKIRQDFQDFKDSFNAPLTIVEVAFEDQTFWIQDSIRIQANDTHRMWQGHRLINIALQELPTTVDKVAWIHPNVIFENLRWTRETSELLDYFPVVQPFSHVDTNNLGYVIKARQHSDYDIKQNNQSPRIGVYDIGWAANRKDLPQGIFDFAIDGSCDIYQLLSWQGSWDNDYFLRLNPAVRMQIMNKTLDDFIVIKNDLGFAEGNVNRLSEPKTDRYDILNKYNFNIENNIQIDVNGLWQWSDDNEDFHQEIASIL